MTEIMIEKCREEAVLPKYANDGDAGMDLYSCADIIVDPAKAFSYLRDLRWLFLTAMKFR